MADTQQKSAELAARLDRLPFSKWHRNFFTVCFLGAATLRGGQFNIFGTFVGAIILRCLENGLVIQGASGSWQKIAKGMVLIAAVGITGVLRRSSQRA